jgi:hypothetical protein
LNETQPFTTANYRFHFCKNASPWLSLLHLIVQLTAGLTLSLPTNRLTKTLPRLTILKPFPSPSIPVSKKPAQTSHSKLNGPKSLTTAIAIASPNTDSTAMMTQKSRGIVADHFQFKVSSHGRVEHFEGKIIGDEFPTTKLPS